MKTKTLLLFLFSIIGAMELKAQSIDWLKFYHYPADYIAPSVVTELRNGDFVTAGVDLDSSLRRSKGWSLIKTNSRGDIIFRSNDTNGYYISPMFIDTSDPDKIRCSGFFNTYWNYQNTVTYFKTDFSVNGKTALHQTKTIIINNKPDSNYCAISCNQGNGYLCQANWNRHTRKYPLFYADTNGRIIWSISDTTQLFYKENSLVPVGKDFFFYEFKIDTAKGKNISSLHITHLDSLGKTLNARTFNNFQFMPGSVKKLNGNYYICGNRMKKIRYKSFPKDTNKFGFAGCLSVMKLDSSLDSVFTRDVFAGPDSVLDFFGDNVYRNDPIDFKINDDNSVAVLWMSNYRRTNDFTYTSFLTVIDGNGDIRWTKILDTIRGNRLKFNALALTNDGGYILAGNQGIVPCMLKLSDAKTGLAPQAVISSGSIIIAPNPASTLARINIQGQNLPQDILKDIAVYLYNTEGRQIPVSVSYINSNIELRRNGLPPGMYFLKLQDKSGRIYTGKMVWQ